MTYKGYDERASFGISSEGLYLQDTLVTPSNNGFRIFGTGNSGGFPVAAEVMRIRADGTVGIGTATPAAGSTLHVQGTVHSSQGFYLPPSSISDARLKTNLMPVTQVLWKLDRLRAVSFNWNEQAKKLGYNSDRREIGLLAQEVGAVFPELVTVSQPEGYQSFDYGRFSAILLEAIKELKMENDHLEETVGKLERRVLRLKQKRAEVP